VGFCKLCVRNGDEIAVIKLLSRPIAMFDIPVNHFQDMLDGDRGCNRELIPGIKKLRLNFESKGFYGIIAPHD